MKTNKQYLAEAKRTLEKLNESSPEDYHSKMISGMRSIRKNILLELSRTGMDALSVKTQEAIMEVLITHRNEMPQRIKKMIEEYDFLRGADQLGVPK